MGRIDTPADLSGLISTYGLKNYVESGFGDGTSFNAVVSLRLIDEFYGIDLNDGFCARLENEGFTNVFCGYSTDELPKVLDHMDERPALYWLDAHFPNADYGGAAYDSEPDVTKRIPLEAELRIIVANRDVSNDVFMMDDLRVYEDGPFSDGSWSLRATAGAEGCAFVDELLGETHNIYRTYQDQGFLVCTPKSQDVSRYIRT